MDNFPKFPRGKLKRNANFKGLIVLGAMIAFWGVLIVLEGEFRNRAGVVVFTGRPAVVVGGIFISWGMILIYHMLFKAEQEELQNKEFHNLEGFEVNIWGYDTKFEVQNSAVAEGKSAIFVFYYILEINFHKSLFMNLDIKGRDKVELLFWKAGITRFWDVLTGSYYFDSRYRVKCTNKSKFHKIFNEKSVQLLEKFDRDYPAIRKRNGLLKISDTSIKYIEGPYREDHRIFDPHRGVIEDLFKELIKIVSELESKNAELIEQEGNPTIGLT